MQHLKGVVKGVRNNSYVARAYIHTYIHIHKRKSRPVSCLFIYYVPKCFYIYTHMYVCTS